MAAKDHFLHQMPVTVSADVFLKTVGEIHLYTVDIHEQVWYKVSQCAVFITLHKAARLELVLEAEGRT